MLRIAKPEDRPAVAKLLRAADLPTDGLMTDVDHLFVLEEKNRIVGAIGFEGFGSDALLRSLVVDPRLRGQGHGATLMRTALQQAPKLGYKTLYGLTTTIPDWLKKLGFEEIPRAEIPEAVHGSMELRGACPESARAFKWVAS